MAQKSAVLTFLENFSSSVTVSTFFSNWIMMHR